MSSKKTRKPYTQAGKQYLDDLTTWLQETRLMSEAIYRLDNSYRAEQKVSFSKESWQKKPDPELGEIAPFEIEEPALGTKMRGLLKSMWSNRFIFLETLWEEYLQNLSLELRHTDTALFEPFCEKEFMADIVKDVVTGKLEKIENIKDEVAQRFAAGITRQPWEKQWKQLVGLKFGLSDKDKEHPWFSSLIDYFEMRNCIIHRQCRVSRSLKARNSYYAAKKSIEIYPAHLDYYRHQFISCLLHIEEKAEASFKPKVKKH